MRWEKGGKVPDEPERRRVGDACGATEERAVAAAIAAAAVGVDAMLSAAGLPCGEPVWPSFSWAAL